MLNRRKARGDIVAMVLVDADRVRRIHQFQRFDDLGEHDVAGVRARAARRLYDDRAVSGPRGLEDRETLFHIVDVEGGDAVSELSRVIEQLSQSDPCHDISCPWLWFVHGPLAGLRPGARGP